MNENYSCICGNEKFIIHGDGTFSCLQCGRLFECGIDETPKEFIKRIKEEARK